MVREGKKQLAESKVDFIKKAADKVESVVNNVISKEVSSFRNDITKARENDFGRRIFESFANEYGTSYLNESKDLKNLQKQIADMDSKLNEANNLLESVKTENLEKQFNKYLPSVLDGKTPRAKKTLSESVVKKEHTGDKAAVPSASSNDETGIVEIDVLRKLAGLSK